MSQSDPLPHLKPLIDADLLAERIAELAAQIEGDIQQQGLDAVLAIALKGGFLFGADLLRALSAPLPVVFVMDRPDAQDEADLALCNSDPDLIVGRDVILVDALLDSGGSAKRLLSGLRRYQPHSVRLAVLLHKTVDRAEPLPVSYLGFETPDLRLVGYGLDEDQRYRGLDAIHAWHCGDNTPC
ncbi:phosphoribosyltransferase [Magnetofaba australis]|uniref:Putative hypoxanthine phosphoribosyltransferase n=1 Tax=Magnetofaba australis IT-1 TaxID=1434232 RepID=A0A1Y2K2I3_9PROT|nr:phosphoribosyltransferase family protein [Magnetofaba australis]OSM01867.1 putative hypoxanthine phosphoribosyltransferase [Magnetofaba australis IT-1]